MTLKLCPTAEDLVCLLNEKLDPVRRTEIGTHVNSCDECQADAGRAHSGPGLWARRVGPASAEWIASRHVRNHGPGHSARGDHRSHARNAVSDRRRASAPILSIEHRIVIPIRDRTEPPESRERDNPGLHAGRIAEHRPSITSPVDTEPDAGRESPQGQVDDPVLRRCWRRLVPEAWAWFTRPGSGA